jgi:hypothetical protein
MAPIVLTGELEHNENLKKACDELEGKIRDKHIEEESQAIWVSLQQIPEADRKQIIESAQSHYRSTAQAVKNAAYHAETTGDAALKALDDSMKFATENASKVSGDAQTVWEAYRKQPRTDSQALEQKLRALLPGCHKGAIQAAINQYEISTRAAKQQGQQAEGYDSAEILGLNNKSKPTRAMNEVLLDFPERPSTTPSSQGLSSQH